MSLVRPTDREIVPLDSLCEKIRGVSYKREEASSTPKEGYLPILRANNVDSDKLRFDELVWVPSSRVKDSQKIKKGDIVVVMSSGSKSVVGKTAQALEDWDGGFGAFCGVLRPNKNAHQRYLGMFLRTKEYRSRISELAAGSNINNLKNEHLANIEVPLVPFEEQRRIVAKLEKLLGKVDACQKRLAKIPVLFKRFRQSILSAACSGQFTGESEGPCSTSTVREISADISYGYTAKSTQTSSGVKYLRITDIQDGSVDWKKVPFCQISKTQLDRFSVKKGDILFARTGATTGKSYLVKECPRTVFASYLIRVRPNKDRILPDYLYLFFQSDDYWRQVSKNISGSAQPNCNASKLATLKLPLPPIIKQKEIIQRAHQFLGLIDRIEIRYKKLQAHVDKLTQSILAKAFCGELVPQDLGETS